MAREENLPVFRYPVGDSLVAFRYSSYDTPFWVRPNSSPSRWALPEDGPTQYLSLHPSGAWAELVRREGLRNEEELAQVRMKIWIAEASSQPIVDYSTFERAEAAGFPPEALVSDDYRLCQEQGRRLRAGYAGVLAPSASYPGALNLTLFGPRRRIEWGTRSQLSSTIPAAVVAIGAPPRGLAENVRHYGEPHSDLERHRQLRGSA